MPAIAVHGLRKSYGAVEAVRDVSFSVEEGEVFGLLGPNGAGKTTTVEILEGYRRRDGGTVTVLGVDPQRGGRKLKERIGLVLQEAALQPYLSVVETIDLFRGYYPHPLSSQKVLELVGLEAKAKARVKTLSGGQQRRLDVALGLVGDPELIFLDEPTTGFDPSARRTAWEMIRSLRSLGKTILLTTHYMEEAQNLADRICVITAGEVIAQGSPQSLRAQIDSRTRIRFALPEAVDPAEIPQHPEVSDGVALIQTDSPTAALHELTAWALQRKVELAGLEVTRASLEDVYLELTGHE